MEATRPFDNASKEHLFHGAPARFALVTVAALVLAAVRGLCASPAIAAQPDASAVKDIKTFIACLNMIKGDKGTIADAAQCVPPCCRFVVTMSKESAQGACELGGCKLPRVIFDCPGPAAGKRFRPSFLLCPIDSRAAGNQFGTDRAELGEDVDSKGSMKMGDVPVPPGTTDFTKITDGDVLSKVVAGKDLGSKSCNVCHNSPNPGADADNNQLSEPIDPFGTFGGTDLGPLVIDTNVPGKTVDPKVQMSLKDICKCIEKNKNKIAAAANDPTIVPMADDRNPNLDPHILAKLCKALEDKTSQKPCETPSPTPTPTPTPPPETPPKSPTATPTGSPENTPTATATPTLSETPTRSETPTQATTATSIPITTPTMTPSQPTQTATANSTGTAAPTS